MSRSSNLDPRFVPHPDLIDAGDAFLSVVVDVRKVIKSYRQSLFAFEWLDPEGHIKGIDDLNTNFAEQRRLVEQNLASGKALPQPVLGIGLLGCVEIGAGRDVLLTLAALGVDTMPVHIPQAMQKDFEKMTIRGDNRDAERGNILVYILLGIVLLAALSFTVSRSMRSTGVSTISESQANTMTTEILTYANLVKTAAVKLKLRGCTDTQISFANAIVAGYTNAGAPADESCHIFSPPGGTITWLTPTAGMNDGSAWFYTGAAVVHNDHGVYSTNVAGNADLVMMLNDLPQEICTKLNDALGLSGIPVNDGAYGDTTKFTGTYAANEDINGLAAASQPSPCSAPASPLNFCGRDAGCFKEESGAERYIFFQTLLKR